MTADEHRVAQALGGCRFAPATWDKKFARDMAERLQEYELSNSQRANLWRLAHRYRRQLPAGINALVQRRRTELLRAAPMTEAEFLTSTSPQQMLQVFSVGGSHAPKDRHPMLTERQMRLFACACCRQVWHLLTDDTECVRCSGRGVLHPRTYCPDCNDNGNGSPPGRVNRSRQAVEVAERYVDGKATDGEREQAFIAAYAAGLLSNDPPTRNAALMAENLCHHDALHATRSNYALYPERAGVTPVVQAALLRCIAGNPWRPVTLPRIPSWVLPGGQEGGWYCPWLRWNNGTIPRMAEAIYQARSFEDLPILADAISEAGCPEDEPCQNCDGTGQGIEGKYGVEFVCPDCRGIGRIPNSLLAHLRGPGPHAMGCHALDILLNKS